MLFSYLLASEQMLMKDDSPRGPCDVTLLLSSLPTPLRLPPSSSGGCNNLGLVNSAQFAASLLLVRHQLGHFCFLETAQAVIFCLILEHLSVHDVSYFATAETSPSRLPDKRNAATLVLSFPVKYPLCFPCAVRPLITWHGMRCHWHRLLKFRTIPGTT